MHLLECKRFVHDLETMPISTDMLEAFVKVADHCSVSAAAADLGIGKSLVSKRVAHLEEAVKATLFSRSTRKVALTSAGEVYLDYARRALLDAAAADERLRNLRTELTGTLRLTAPVSWGQRVLARLIPEFLAQHPAIDVELLLGDRMMDIAHERVDIALRWTPFPAQELVATPVARVEWVICAAPAYLERTGLPGQPHELARHPCMAYWRESSDDGWQLVRGEERAPVRVHGRYRVNDTVAVAQAALAGLGIALLPRYMCDEELAAGRLVRVLPEWTPDTRFGTWITALAAPDRARFSRHRVFLDFLRQRLG